MVRNPATARWLYGAAYASVMGVIILIRLIPVEFGPHGYPGPDFLICITFAWLLRRPHNLPTPLIALAFLVADMLFMRPPGLWTALVVLAAEFLRAREASSRELPFLAEWAMVSAVLMALSLANHVILLIFSVNQVALSPMLLQVAATALVYPVIVILSRLVFGVDKLIPGETDRTARTGRPR